MNGKLRRWILGKDLLRRIEKLERYICIREDAIGFEIPDDSDIARSWDTTGNVPSEFDVGD